MALNGHTIAQTPHPIHESVISTASSFVLMIAGQDS
jgi:hypothetical protein